MRNTKSMNLLSELFSSGREFHDSLGRKKNLRKKVELLIPGFITDPFIKNFLSDTSLLSSFLSSGTSIIPSLPLVAPEE